MDLSTIDGLTEEQKQAILAAHEDNITGLKNKNSELLGKVNDSKAVVSEKERIAEEARQAAVKAEEERLLAEGKYNEAQQLREKERAELVAKAESEANAAKEMLKQRDLKDVHFGILSKVHENFAPAAQAMLSASTDVTYGDDGTAIVSIRSGEKEFSNTNDFLKHAETDPTWSAMLKAPNTQGSGANGSQGGQAASGDKDSDFKKRLRESGLTS